MACFTTTSWPVSFLSPVRSCSLRSVESYCCAAPPASAAGRFAPFRSPLSIVARPAILDGMSQANRPNDALQENKGAPSTQNLGSETGSTGNAAIDLDLSGRQLGDYRLLRRLGR